MLGQAPIVCRKAVSAASYLVGSGLLGLALWAVPARAAEGSWQDKPYHYVAIDQDLRSALLEFGRNVRIPVKLGDDVKGRLRAMPTSGDARGFLERLAQAHGLIWYFDGTSLHVDSQSALKTELVALNGASPAQLDQMLLRLGIADSRFPLRSAARGVIAVSGPPAYRNLVREALSQLKGGGHDSAASRPSAATPADAAAKVRVFRGGPPDGS